MRQLVFALLVIVLIASCEKTDDNQISDGCYEGYFDYHATSYWSLICFEDGKYVEWPSGGAFYQKEMTCLTVGTYSTKGNILSFELDSFKFTVDDILMQCISDMVLPGRYDIIQTEKQDSLIFKRGTSENQITYYLKKQ